ncbi:MAG: hypothetical protein ABSH10_08790 [Phycisphaerae bacterium]
MTSIADIAISTRVATLMGPVAVYFLVLGLLNTRRRPQMLTGRTDFALLIAALSPLVFLPVLRFLGGSPLIALAIAVLLAGMVLALSPSRSWVVYNISAYAAADAVAAALGKLGVDFARSAEGFVVEAEGITITVGGFPLLRNATIRLRGADRRFTRAFQAALAANRLPWPSRCCWWP